jgi:hypothetical protein
MRHRKLYLLLIIPLLIEAVFLIWDSRAVITQKPAKQYLVYPFSCGYQEKTGAEIKFSFTSSQKTSFRIPEYAIEDNIEKGTTKIIFQNSRDSQGRFLYEEVIDNPLIINLNYYNQNGSFVVEIERKGVFKPTKINKKGSLVEIVLPEGDGNDPVIYDQKPGNDSTAYPSPLRMLNFKTKMQNPFKSAAIYFQGKQINDVSIDEISENNYFLSFSAQVLKDEQHTVKAIVTDEKNRTTISTWTFEGRIPIDEILGKDRFKYLGWWGEIKLDGVSVRKGPGVSFERLGALSSINRVKVLKEVIGEEIDGNNLWYQIDGGVYPGSYVFSELVAPMVQPAPPDNFIIPKEVSFGEYWIDVDLTKKILTLFLYEEPVFTTYISSGRPENPTEEGTFRVWWKLTKKRMRGGPPLHSYIYDLDNVPHVLFYNGSYAIHGTYWHDKFGSQQSAGCTNMTQGDAAYIFEKVKPALLAGKESVLSSDANPGTVVYNHY